MRVDFGTGSSGLECLREHCRDLCDVEPLSPIEEFRADSESIKVGSTLFVLSHYSSLAYLRRPVHILRGHDDHFQIQLQFDGRLCGAFNELSEGDIGIHDTGRPSDTKILAPSPDRPARVLVWMIPRILIVPLLASPDAVHGMRLAASLPYTQMLREALWLVWKYAPRCTKREGETAAYSLLLLLVSGLARASEVGEAASEAAQSMRLATIERYIETHLDSSVLQVSELARRFGLSRASLYRLFEPRGGLTSYVRSRRLHRASQLLVSPVHRHLRILDIALESRFASETSFIRAFRREFGISPAELRASIDAHGVVRPAAVQPIEWLREIQEPCLPDLWVTHGEPPDREEDR